ncbi:MAG: amidase [Hyphomicrobiaceae bacterium]
MDLVELSACRVVELLQGNKISPRELLDVLEAQIAAVDSRVNALPILCFERAHERACAIEATPVAERGLLAGLPVAIKDLSNVAGVRSTQGSPIFADFIPETSDYVVEQIEREGGIVYAKSNTPEFGAGANTFNEVFGATRNPWDLHMSAAGSSGGSAVALATGMAWLAQGSDMGGSLRNPASFCNVVGMRSSPGRVPRGPVSDPYATLSAEGPMARTIDDVALFLDAMSTPDRREPLSLEKPVTPFRRLAENRTPPKRVAFSADLGITPVNPEVAAVCRQAADRFADMGVPVEEAHPDFSAAHETFQTLRAHDFAVGMTDLFRDHSDALKPEVIWNIEKGLALTSLEIGRAQRDRGNMVGEACRFFETYDLLLTPATIVPPFPVEERFVKECAGQTFETYIDWLAIAYAITLVSLPALSLPCGFTKSGLPVGLQMVGKMRGEGALLAAAGVLEDALGIDHTPIRPREAALASG